MKQCKANGYSNPLSRTVAGEGLYSIMVTDMALREDETKNYKNMRF
jgi:hypothetical protein